MQGIPIVLTSDSFASCSTLFVGHDFTFALISCFTLFVRHERVSDAYLVSRSLRCIYAVCIFCLDVLSCRCTVCVDVSDTLHMSVVIYFHDRQCFDACWSLDLWISCSACVAFATDFNPFGIAFLSFLPISTFFPFDAMRSRIGSPCHLAGNSGSPH